MTMNKCFQLIGILIFATVLSSSCTKTETIDQTNPEQAIEASSTVTYTCTIATPEDTKLLIDGDGKTKWEMTDEILIHGEYMGQSGETINSVVVSPSSISADGKTATFEVDSRLVKYDRYYTTLYAAYPASAVKTYKYGDRWYYWTRFNETNLPLMIGVNDNRVDENAFTFFNCCASITFKVSGTFDAYKFESNKSTEAVGYGTYQVRAHYSYHNSEKGIFDFNNTGDGGDPTSGPIYSIIKTEWTGADGSTVNSLYFPNGIEFTEGFKLTFYNEGTPVEVLSTHTHITLARNDFLPLGDISTRLKTAPEESHDLASWTSEAVDITGAGDAANCYYLYTSDAGNKYKIPAVKGNDRLQTLKPYGAVVLWETWNNDDDVTEQSIIDEVDYDGSYVYFKLADPLVAGNALIAATDALGQIIWSWHIWVPDSTIGKGTYGISNSTRMIMDRNLGALVVAGDGSIEANGLYYQWGRKDPFMGPRSQSSSSITTFAGPGVKTLSSGASNVATSIKNPTQFIVATGSKSNYDWMLSSSSSLWSSTKTIYDPCPPGWKVPNKSDLTIFNSSAYTLNSGVEGWYNSSNKCATVGTAVFPLAGILQYDTGNVDYRATRAAVWSTETSDWSSGCAIWMDIKGSGESQSNYNGERKGRAASVRCIAIE